MSTSFELYPTYFSRGTKKILGGLHPPFFEPTTDIMVDPLQDVESNHSSLECPFYTIPKKD